MNLKAYKFVILPGEQNSVALAPEDQTPNGNLLVDGRIAIAIAETQEAARELLTRIANELGLDPRWLKVAKVTEIALDKPCRLCWVEM